MHTIFQNPIPEAGSVFEPEAREAEHLFRVFRLRKGDRVRLIDGCGTTAVAAAVENRQLCVEKCEIAAPSEIELHLSFAIPKKNKLDDLLPQLPGLGVRALHPLLLDHSVATGVNKERWEQILKEGCKQSGNPYLPELCTSQTLEEVLAYAAKQQIVCYFGSVTPAQEIPAEKTASETKRMWIVGPEGGFSAEEESFLLKHDVRPLQIGKWIMRLETAAIAGLSVLTRAVPLLLFCCFLLSGCGKSNPAGNPLMRKADYYFSSGDAELAEKFYQRLLRQYPNSAELHRKLGTLHDELKQDSIGAVYHYNAFLKISPDSPDAPAIRKYREMALAKLQQVGNYQNLLMENRRLKETLIRIMKRQSAPAPRPAAVQEKLHRVKSGENVRSIAGYYQIPLKSLLAANGLNSSVVLKPGQVLKIPDKL